MGVKNVIIKKIRQEIVLLSKGKKQMIEEKLSDSVNIHACIIKKGNKYIIVENHMAAVLLCGVATSTTSIDARVQVVGRELIQTIFYKFLIH